MGILYWQFLIDFLPHTWTISHNISQTLLCVVMVILIHPHIFSSILYTEKSGNVEFLSIMDAFLLSLMSQIQETHFLYTETRDGFLYHFSIVFLGYIITFL